MDQDVFERVISLSTGERLDYDVSKTWIDLFEDQVLKCPEKKAVVAENGSLSYEELNLLSDRLAAALTEKEGIGPDEFVAVRMGRVKEFHVAALAIHKAGAAYMPIDLEYPADRVDYMMEDSGARLTLTEESVEALLKEECKVTDIKGRQGQDRRAYMIYTSGSTGKPKGVVIPHRALTNFVHFIAKRWGLSERSRIVLHSNFAFDAAVEDLFPALTVGGTVFVVPESARKDVFEMRDYILKNKINGGSYSTQFGQLLAMDEPLDVDYLCMGGEAMTIVPKARGPVYNVYGPTEFTVDATYFELEKGREYGSIPIGRPLYNCSAYIVNDKLELLPPGETGELCLVGPQLAEGYWKRPDLTQKAFTTMTLPGGEAVRIYRTGDLAFWNDEGQLEFCGRIDTQVKLRGFRIELGEVESRAARFPGIRQTAAEVRKNTLCLYYTSDEDTDEAALSAFMGESLADYMVPGVFIKLDDMPLNVNGKIDRKKLPDPKMRGTVEYAAPETEVEKDVVSAMARVLGADETELGVTQDFFELGGDSIKAIRLVSLLREKGYFPSVADVMEARNARLLALELDSFEGEAIDQEPYEGDVEDTSIFAFFKDLDYLNPAYYNQSTLLKVNGSASLDALQKASDAIAYQHDMLRAVIRDGHLYVRPASETITVEEYTLDKDETESIKKLCEDIQSGLDTEKSLVRLALLHAGERDLFFLTAHHTIVDGVSWRIWMDDLETAYGQALSGDKISLPAKTHTYRDYADAMKAYRCGYVLSLEIPYWKGVEERMLKLDTSDNKDYTRHFDTLSVSMSKEDTDAFLRTKLNVLRLEVNDLLLTALGQGYREVFNKDAVSVSMEGHGREELGRKLSIDRTIGWFTSVYPVVLEGFSLDAKEDLIRVKETLHAIPNKGVGYNILAFVDGTPRTNFQTEKAPMVIFNYLGDVSGEGEKGKYFEPDSADGFSAGLDYYDSRNHDGSDLVINCLVDKGCFTLWLDYNSGRFGKDKAESFAEAILKKINELGSFLNAQSKEIAMTASDLGETEWSIEEFQEVISEFAGRNETIQRIYPLTPMQEGMLLEHVSHPESRAYRLIDIYECKRPLDEEKLRQAVDAMAERHEVLRSAIIHKGVSRFRQAVVDRKLPLRIVDLTGSADPFLEAQKIRQDILDNGYDLQDKPLTQFVYAKTPGGGYLIFATHHIITDGWCFDTMLRDLNALLNEGADLTGSSNGQYERVVRELLKRDRNAAVSYYGKLLEGYENNAVIPSWGEIPDEKQDEDDRIIAVLPTDITQRLSELCKEAGATLADGFNLAWGLVLSTLNRTDDVVFSTITSGRDGYSIDVSELVGLFINPVPVRVRAGKDDTARSMLTKMNRQAAETKPHDFCPLSDIQNALGADTQLTGLIISFENYSQEEQKDEFLKPVFIREEHEAGSVDVDASVLSDGTIRTILSYDPALYSGKDMERIMALFENYAKRITDTPDVPLNTLPHLSDPDIKAICELSKGDTLDIDINSTWIDLFKAQAERTPDAAAVSDETGSYTYSELDRASDSLASYLIDKGIAENTFVAIRMGRDKEFLAAAIGVHKAGAAYVPIDPEYPKDRIDYMLNDSEAGLLLEKEDVLKAVRDYPDPAAVNRAAPGLRAYMIYTSGSTGLPKGVMIAHSALHNFVRFIAERWGLNESSRVALHSTFSFDAAVEDLYPALTVGGMIFVVPERARKDIFEMRRCIEENHLNSGCYSTQFGQLLGMDEPLDINYICVGGEAMTTIPKCRGSVYNTYGPTEFTVDATYYELDKNRTYRNIPIGRPLYNCAAYVLDAQGRLLPKGCTGELCLAGPQLALGYWKKPELTEEKFTHLSLPGKESVRIYKTGDLVRWNDEDQLEFFGRIDFQVKLRGFRIELGEIESVCMEYPGVSAAAAEVKKSGTTQILCLYYTVKEGTGFDEEELKGLCRKRLTDYMVPSVFLRLEKMPLSPSGKVNRKALPMPEAAENTDIVVPETETERKLHEIAAGILGTDQFGVTDDLVSLGLTSIAAMRFAALISQTCDMRVSVAQILKNPVIRDLAETLDGNSPKIKESLKPYPKQELYPITENQRGIIIDWELNRGTTQYNIPEVIRFDNVDAGKLKDAVITAVNAHAYLKTIFVYDDGEIKQKRRDDDEVAVSLKELKEAPDKAFFQSRILPFDLYENRLYRFEIYTHGSRTWLFWDIHHTVYDGLSRDVLIKDVRRALSGEDIEAETLTAYDFAIYEKGLRESDEYTSAVQYFDGLLSDAQVAVFADSQAPDNKPDGELELSIPGDKIDEFCKRCGVTPGSFFQAAFSECLRRITREEKPLYITASNGRSASVELMDCVGMFVKTIPVAADNMGDVTLKDYVVKMHRQMQESYARDFYPYTEFVEKHGLRAEMMLVYQGGITNDEGSGDDTNEGLDSLELNLDTAKLPILVNIFPKSGRYVISIEYDGMRYSRKDIGLLANSFGNMALTMTVSKMLSDAGTVSDEEANELKRIGEGEKLKYDRTETLTDLFRRQAEKTPDAVAVVFKDKKLTYRELDEITDRLAGHLLKTYKVKPEEAVGVMIDRSELMVIYPLSIMKAGAAYMPLDFHFPAERLQYMCEDAGVRLILSEQQRVKEAIPDFEGSVMISDELGSLQSDDIQLPEIHVDYRYVILYTSGSTGKPKGVVLEQHSIVNFCYWYVKECRLCASDHVMAYANFGFDCHMMDVFPALTVGAGVYVIESDIRLDLPVLNQYMEDNGITIAFMTTQVGHMFVSTIDNRSLRFMSVAGEKLMPVKKPRFELRNGYGPTECTIYSTCYSIDEDYTSSLIGRPLANYNAYVVDTSLKLVPYGVAGELVVAGEGVGRGYMHPSEKDANKFTTLFGMPCYRTGDLVRWSTDNNLEYIGRIDGQVKLRGLRIEMGEIESRASKFEGVKQVAAAVKKDQIVLYYTLAEGGQADPDDLKVFLAETLTEYMVPTIYVPLEVMPLNANGKIDRKALPEPEITVSRESVAAETNTEQKLFEIASQILGTENFGVTDNLISLGLSSLGAMRFALLGSEACGVHLTIGGIMQDPVIRTLAAQIDQDASGSSMRLKPYPKQELYPITENQRGVILDWERSRNTTQYNIPEVLVYEDTDGEKLMQAVRSVLDAHVYLKTGFVYKDGDVMQIRRDEDDPLVGLTVLAKEPDREFFQSLIKPFDLFNDRLYRFEVYTFGNKAWLFMDVHHTIFDGLSKVVFIRDIDSALRGEKPEGEALTAYDLALYEKDIKDSGEYTEAKGYFDNLMQGAAAAVLPDSKTPDKTEQGTIESYIPADGIDDFCRSCGVTVGSFFEAVFAQCLYRVTREEKPFYVTVSNGRSSCAGLMDSVGMFVKTVAVVGMSGKDMTCEDYVKVIHSQLQESYEREFYPYTHIVEEHGLKADMMLVYQGGIAAGKDEKTSSDCMELELDETKFPISVEIMPDEKDYLISVEYDGMKYSRADMEQFAGMIKNLAQAFVPGKNVCDIGSVTGEERKAILEKSAGETLKYDETQTWIDMVLTHAASDPERIAVVDQNGSYTYKELDEASNRIAAWLIKNGVEANSFVAIKMDRVKEFFASVIGVQKAGAAYVPVDPAYPEDRIAYMLEDSQSPVTLDEKTVGQILSEDGKVQPVNRATPDTYAYMIYTSGSTGKPKGVVISQHSLSAYIAWATRDFGYKEGGHYAHCVTFSFDASVTDIVCPLFVGAQVHVISTQMRLNPAALAQYLNDNRIEGVKFPTQLGMLMLNNYPDMYPSFTVLGGEKLLPVAKTHVLQYNEYGPTEFTIGSDVHLVDQETDVDIPIGKAVPNSFSLICDPGGQLLPWGMVGELCLAGRQIASGYWRRPDLTAERFVDCPVLPGMKMYHTGDLARYNNDGELEYLGRIDNQVKLRGFRIEMGEIENRASLFERIEQVAAAVKKDQLILYYSTAGGTAVDHDKLKDFLAEALTDYMVPTVYIHLPDMPITPAGKIDRKALPEPELKERVIEEPENELQKTLCEMFEKALSLDEVGVNESFFTLGGTSLKAASVMMAAMVDNLPITYQDIFNNPTVRELEELIIKKRADEGEIEKIKGAKIEKHSERRALEHNRNEYVDEIEGGPLGNVLLTGATGFLGAHVLYDLIKNTDERVYCLVRSGDIDYRRKLRNVLAYYFERELIDELDKRIIVIEGDIEDVKALDGTKDLDYHTVINCAACVKHFADIDFLKKINLYGVENLTRLCIEKGVRLIQISTISVSGDAIGGIRPDQVLTEDKLEIGQVVESNAYVYTKYLAEQHVLKAIEEDDLDAKIIRVGNLSSRVKDGEFQMNFLTNATMNTLRAYSVLGCFPVGEMSNSMEFSYIDETARAVVLLSGTDRAFTVFHAYNGHSVEMGDIIYAMNACGLTVKSVTEEEYSKRLKEGLKSENINSYLATLVGYDLDDDEIREEIPADNHFTINALYKLGHRFTITDLNVIEKMIEAMKSLDFFDCDM